MSIKTDPVNEFSEVVDTIKSVRMSINDGWRQIIFAREQVDNFIATGKAHTECKLLDNIVILCLKMHRHFLF